MIFHLWGYGSTIVYLGPFGALTVPRSCKDYEKMYLQQNLAFAQSITVIVHTGLKN